MASHIFPSFQSHRFQLFATAVLSGAGVAALLLGYQTLAREERIHDLKASVPSLEEPHEVKRLNSFGASSGTPEDKEDARNQALAKRAQAGDFDDELILEQLARNRVFLTPQGLDKLRESFIVIVGCGGVGSHAAAALARSGASKIRLIDFDQVTLSSLNRHAVATLGDVGIPKVRCLERRLIAIAPWVQFDLRQEKFDEDVAEAMLGPWQDKNGRKPDYVIDAIDNIDTKVSLLKHCHDHNLPVISAMGAGCKSDPTRIIVGDVSQSTDDRLSRSTRRKLKLRGVTSGIPVVFSTEKTGDGKAELLPLPEEEFQRGAVGDLGAMPNFRVRILPVLGTMPAIFGLTVANHVILSISGYPLDYVPAKGREKMYDGMLAFVQGVEEGLARAYTPGLMGIKTPITQSDVAFVAEEIYRARSVVSGLTTRLVLVRWEKPTSDPVQRIEDGDKTVQKCTNIRLRDFVCLTKEEAVRHEKLVLKGEKKVEELYDQEVLKRVAALQEEAAGYEHLR